MQTRSMILLAPLLLLTCRGGAPPLPTVGAGDLPARPLVDVQPDAAGRRGPLKVSPLDDRYRGWPDGSLYIPVGENMAWYDGRGTFAYDHWMEKLAAAGGNYIRIWMASWGFGLEWLDGDQVFLGRYRLDRAWQLDRVMDRADELGIHVMLCIQNHGPFSEEINSEWEMNPYNLANGGPIAHPPAFFTDHESITLFKRRVRYIAARWGYATKLVAWELPDGEWQATWIPTHGGEAPQPAMMTVEGGLGALQVPAFARDIAFILRIDPPSVNR